MSWDDYLEYSLERLKKEKWHIVIFENSWEWVVIYNYWCRDRVLNYFILWEKWEKYIIDDVKKILFYNALWICYK